MKNRLIFALDVATETRALYYARLLSGHVGCFKIGLELFTSAMRPRRLVRDIADHGDVFLDLKLHDIPTTVARTAAGLADLGVKYTTVHVGDDGKGIAAAVKAAPDVKILGVTVLTSVESVRYADTLCDLVKHRAELAFDAGAWGVVCAAPDLGHMPYGHYVTPGIRLPDGDAGDQARVATPESAIEAGADMIVVGRPIRDAVDPVAAAAEIVRRMWNEVLSGPRSHAIQQALQGPKS